MNPIKLTVMQNITTIYEFRPEDYPLWRFKTQDEFEEFAKGWATEDFIRLENHADNILPPYTSTLHFGIEEVDTNEETR